MTEAAVAHVEVFGGRLSRPTTIHGAGGPRLDFTAIGALKFFVDVIEADGCRITMWDGDSYEEAILNAEELSADGFGPVVDNLIGGRA